MDNEAKKVQRQLRLEEAVAKGLQRQETAASVAGEGTPERDG
jgi:hypothetical protein